MSAFVASLKTMGLIGGLALFVWFLFKMLCQKYQEYQLHLDLIAELMRVTPKTKQKKVNTYGVGLDDIRQDVFGMPPLHPFGPPGSSQLRENLNSARSK